MCRFFDVSRSGYYDYVKRMNSPAWDLPLAEKIRECQERSHSTYGYRRVHIWLERQGIHKNPKTILRVMRKYNLLSVVRRKNYRNHGEYLHRYPNLLNRDFHAECPNQKWVTDISHIKTGQGVLYLSVIRDLFFSILKTECIYRAKIHTYEEARLLIGAYIQFYNNERIQLKAKLTPLEMRCQFIA